MALHTTKCRGRDSKWDAGKPSIDVTAESELLLSHMTVRGRRTCFNVSDYASMAKQRAYSLAQHFLSGQVSCTFLDAMSNKLTGLAERFGLGYEPMEMLLNLPDGIVVDRNNLYWAKGISFFYRASERPQATVTANKGFKKGKETDDEHGTLRFDLLPQMAMIKKFMSELLDYTRDQTKTQDSRASGVEIAKVFSSLRSARPARSLRERNENRKTYLIKLGRDLATVDVTYWVHTEGGRGVRDREKRPPDYYLRYLHQSDTDSNTREFIIATARSLAR